jgi:hypothetical protein
MNQALSIPGSRGQAYRLQPRLGWTQRIVPRGRGIGIQGVALGDLTNTQIAKTVGGAVGSGLLTVGGALSATVGGAVVGIPLMIAGAFAEIAGSVASLFSGCGPTCNQASNIANQAAVLLQENLDEFRNGPQTADRQAQALAVFDYTWQQLVQACSNPALGAAGQRCIGDRQRSGKYPWAVYYRDPIAGAQVTASTVLASDGTPVVISPATGGVGSALPLLLIVGLVAWALS